MRKNPELSRDATPERDAMLDASAKVPQHVVFRSFPSETVVLNLQTGKYHGLNPTAGHMLDVLAKGGSVGDSAALVAEEYEQPLADTERDICDLCRALAERGLVELEENAE
jgi:Coenzyme PQQ synthesis protein D (PqqD)